MQSTITPDSPHPFWQIIRVVPDFPKQGIAFYDITPLLRAHVNAVIDALLAAIPQPVFDAVDCLGKGMVLIRKEGKLPPPVANKSYALEYGTDTLEMQAGLAPANVLLVDDILATGGTLSAAVGLCEAAGHQVLGALVLLDLVDLHQPLAIPLYTVLQAKG